MTRSLFQKLFGRNVPQSRVPQPVPKSSETRDVFLNSADLLKEATRLKQTKQYDRAIEVLRQAYRQIQREPVDYAIATYLRLPMMLHLAGRSDEAWREYNRLLLEDVTGVGLDSPVRPMELAQVYDKMRLFLQREKRYKEAIRMAALFHFCWGWGLKVQRRSRELRQHVTRKEVAVAVRDALTKAGLEDRLPRVVRAVHDHLALLPDVDLGKLARDVAAAVQ